MLFVVYKIPDIFEFSTILLEGNNLSLSLFLSIPLRFVRKLTHVLTVMTNSILT